MQFDIITIFPHILDSYISESILWRAQKKKLIKIKMHNMRDVTTDKHKTVDDKPFGGGPGMVMKIDVIYKALKKIKRCQKSRVIMLDPKGKQFDQKMAARFSKLDQLIFICGRYEGIDARVDKFVDEKVSIGPYILSGGELGAGVIIEAVARLVPGVLGNQDSLIDETFNNSFKIQNSKFKILSEYPQYTRPEVFEYKEKGKIKKLRVPKVLLSGNHKEIKKWKQKQEK